MRLRDVALVGIVAAMTFVLGIVGYSLPNGGRISLAPMAILMLSLGVSWRLAVLAGAIAGGLQFLSHPVAGHPLSIVLDYPLASACLGLAGLFAGERPLQSFRVGFAIVLCVALKLWVHVVSGVVFWSQGLTSFQAWSFSYTYNLSFMGPQCAVDLLVMVPLTPRIGRLGALAGRSRRGAMRS